MLSKIFNTIARKAMKDVLVMLDNGHGYDTPGKRSPKWKDGTQLYEYEFNRDIVRRIQILLKSEGIRCVVITPEENDVPLSVRVKRANEYYRNNKDSFLVSVHANAGGGTGFEVWTSVGHTKSDDIASCFWNAMKTEFPDKKMRMDMTDGDVDKESNFYILKNTKCPAVLTENFFMDNEQDCKLIMSNDGRMRIAKAHVEAIKKAIQEVYK